MDAVGHILAERQHDRLPLGAGLSLAILLHAGVAAALIASALARPVRFLADRAVSVRLMPAGALQGGAAVAVPAQPVPQAEAEPQRPRIEKAVEPPPPPTSKALLLPAKEKKAEPPAPVSRTSETKKTEAPKPPGDPNRSGAGATINSSGAGVGIGGARLDQADFQYAYYIERMILAVGMNWFKPAQIVPVSPVVRFQVERDGTVTDPEIEVSSGLPFVDRAALRAVMAASLPPLPPDYAGSRLGVHLIFEK